LGLYPDEDKLQDLYRERHSAKQAILDSLTGHGVLPEGIGHDVSWVGMNTALAHALQEHMCRGNSALFSTQLEDGWRWINRSMYRALALNIRTGGEN
jgi:hypothetical protein